MRPAIAASALCLGLLLLAALPATPQTPASPTDLTPSATQVANDDAAKHAKRTACLKDAKAKKLVGADKTAFIKNCVDTPADAMTHQVSTGRVPVLSDGRLDHTSDLVDRHAGARSPEPGVRRSFPARRACRARRHRGGGLRRHSTRPPRHAGADHDARRYRRNRRRGGLARCGDPRRGERHRDPPGHPADRSPHEHACRYGRIRAGLGTRSKFLPHHAESGSPRTDSAANSSSEQALSRIAMPIAAARQPRSDTMANA